MGRKQYLFLGLAVVLVGLAVAGVLLWPKVGGLTGMVGRKQTENTATEKKSEAKVVSWQPETATLVYQDERNKQQTIVIQSMKPMVIVRVYEGDIFVKEELTLTPIYTHWQKAFCSGDELVMTLDPDGTITEIRNKGLRQCVN